MFREIADLNTDLIIGETYKMRIKAKNNGVGSNSFLLWTGMSYTTTALNTSFVWYEITFVATSIDGVYIRNSGMGAGEIVWIDEWYIQEWHPDGRVIRVGE